MVAAAILKCVLLAQFQVQVIQTPIDEYATAAINHTYNGASFEGTVFEGKLNSVKIELPAAGAQTMSFSSRDPFQKGLSTQLDVKNDHASIECEIIEPSSEDK